MLTPWKEGYDQPRQHIKNQRHYFVKKGPSSQGYGFPSGHVRMWELDCEDSWVPKNWCFWTVVLEKTLGSPLDCKEIQPVHPKGDQSWVFIGRTDAEAETPIQHLMRRVDSWEKTLMLGGIGGRRRRGWQEDEMVGWHHQLSGHGFGWIRELVMEREAWRAAIHRGAESNTTKQLNWTELKSQKLR